MSDLETLGAPGDARIDIHDESDCRYWCARLGIRPKRLKQIVHAVGNRASDVDNYLSEAQLHEYFEEDNTEANPT